MDKNMISIDDLVKQRLSGAEEKERPGAWLHMRDLLDKQMPVAAPAIYNWRRILGYVAGILVLTTATIGSYNAFNSNSPAQKELIATVANRGTNTITTDKTANKLSVSTSSVNTTTTNNSKPDNNNNSKNIAATTSNKNVSSADKKSSNGKHIDVNSNSVAKLALPKPAQTSGTISVEKSITPAQNNFASGNTTPARKASDVMPKQGNLNATPSTSGASPIVPSGGTAGVKPAPKPAEPAKTNPRYVDKVKVMDSAEMIFTKESIRGGQTMVTTTREMIAREKEYVLPETESNFYSHPAVAATLSSVDEASLEKLSNYKISSRKSKNYNSNRWETMVQNAKVNLSGATFHPGLMLGVSSSVGTYSMTGINAGIAGIMGISEHWSMFAELKYIYRFGNGKSLYNNYNRLTDTKYISNNTFSYGWDSVEHYFNITSSSSLELPIALRYSFKRVNMFVGVNSAYNMAVNVYEKENAHAKEYISSGTASTLTSQWNTETPVITYNDFSARFTMGYLFGVGYQVSPAVGFDVRIAQPIWDNVKSKGAYEVSKEMYRTPSFQFNFTYRLSNNKYKVRSRR